MQTVSSVLKDSPKKFDCGEEGLAYLAGYYIAHKFCSIYPELGTKTCDFHLFHEDSSPWITQLSRGGLVKPSEDFLKTVKEFEKLFEEFHSDKINTTKVVISKLVENLQKQHPTVPTQLIKKFARTRTFIRLKHLNQDIKTASLLKRNIQQKKQFSS